MNSTATDNSMDFDQLAPEQQEQLLAVLEQYMEDLSAGKACDIEQLAADHPDIAQPLKGYVGSLNLLHEAAGGLGGSGLGGPGHAATASPHLMEKQLGDFEIGREIGRGGMGIVYEAKQISLGRRVALKVLPFAAVLDRKQIARFEREAQAAAQLHHPNIVPVYSVGCERGVHYYSMQFIEGQALDRAICELRETTGMPSLGASASGKHSHPTTAPPHNAPAPHEKQPLSTCKAFSTVHSIKSKGYLQTVAELGVQAADALEHAHLYGIIHRDIKPSNLLIDERGKLWVTDFGLARVQTDPGVTVTGDVMGTVRYMSPEQAGGKTSFVDERSDVYSLGITLYELLTLRHACDAEDRQQFIQKILNDEPTAPRRFNSAIPVDLETIVLKAIAKSREQRYATAAEFAADLRRFLTGQPTLARRPTSIDRATKWAARHRTLVAAAAVIMLFALVGTSIAALLIAREKAATDAALVESKKNLARSYEHLRKAREVVDRLGARQAERLGQIAGAELLRDEVLRDTLRYYHEFLEEARDDESLQADLAITHFKAAKLTEQIGVPEKAIAEYERAKQVSAQLAQDDPETPDHRRRVALCHNNIALLLSRISRPDEARQQYHRAIEIQQQLVAAHPENAKFENDLALFYGNLGLLESKHDRDAAEPHYQRAVDIQRRLVERHPEDDSLKSALGLSYNNLGFLFSRTDADRARQCYTDAIEIQQALADRHPDDLDYQSNLALSLNNLSSLLAHLDRSDEAQTACHQAIAIQERLWRKAPAVTAHRRDLAISYNNLGRLCSESAKQEEAAAAFRLAGAILSQLVDDFPHDLTYRSSLGGVFNNLGMIQEKRGELLKAVASYQQAIAHQRAARDAAPAEPQFREFLSKHYFNCGRTLRALGRGHDAAEMALERRQLWPGRPTKLYHVAAELALAIAQLKSAAADETGDSAVLVETYTAEAVDTLREAVDSGFRQFDDVQQNHDFDTVREDPRLRELLASQLGS